MYTNIQYAEQVCECILVPKSALLPILVARPQLCYTIAEVKIAEMYVRACETDGD